MKEGWINRPRWATSGLNFGPQGDRVSIKSPLSTCPYLRQQSRHVSVLPMRYLVRTARDVPFILYQTRKFTRYNPQDTGPYRFLWGIAVIITGWRIWGQGVEHLFFVFVSQHHSLIPQPSNAFCFP